MFGRGIGYRAVVTTTFDCAFSEDTRTLTVTGNVDVAEALELRRQVIAHAADRPLALTMDLSLVESLSGPAVGVIAAARAEMRAHYTVLRLVSPRGSVAERVLPASGMAVADA